MLGTAAALAAAWGLSTGGALAAGVSGEPVVIGVSGPLTGQDAQYGEQWKRGFDLALDEINGSGGIHGRPLAVDFQDSRSDPRWAVAIAQKFVADPRIAIELGDFSSATSMAASPIYQRGQLIQFGFTNSHPDFTKGGDYLWSTALSQAEEQPLLALRGEGARLQADRGAVPEHRLGPHQQGHLREGGGRGSARRSSRPKAISRRRRISARRSCASANRSPIRSC